MKKYTEDAEITHYIWTHYSQFCTEIENLAYRAIQAQLKAQNVDDPAHAQIIREKWGSENNADVCAVLADGNKTFLKRTCDRILQEHGEQIFINRCPKCKRIVKTPIACLCLWCGYTWFELRVYGTV